MPLCKPCLGSGLEVILDLSRIPRQVCWLMNMPELAGSFMEMSKWLKNLHDGNELHVR